MYAIRSYYGIEPAAVFGRYIVVDVAARCDNRDFARAFVPETAAATLVGEDRITRDFDSYNFV